jgi:benzoyl-CoA reductase/2-hydroxyglutaryl-CoA dehydratase subunit BcrC/BadD/HgdB
MQAQRIFDNAEFVDNSYPHHLFVTPRLVGERALGFYLEEMRKLKAMVEAFSGTEVTDEKLRASVELYNESRRLIKQLYELRKVDKPVITGAETLKWTLAAISTPKEEFNVQLKNFLKTAKDLPPVEGHDVRVLLIGSAMDDPEYVKNLEDQGCLVVSDVQCFGSRPLWEEVEAEGDIFQNIAEMYLRRPACPRMSDTHDQIVKTIKDMADEYRVQGIIYLRMKNCDPWGGESLFFRDLFKEADLPILEIEKEEITSNAGQIAVRTGAFVEMLEEREL